MNFFKKQFQKLKQFVVVLSKIWFYDVRKLPVGTHFYYFLTYRIRFSIQTVFDVGANNGSTVKLFKSFFPRAEIVCFEPFAATFEKLQKNTAHLNNIHLHKIALSDLSSKMTVSVLPDEQSVANSLANQDQHKLSTSSNKEIIEVQTIDGFLDAHPQISCIDLLKIDTEGFDLKVLMGATKALRQMKIRSIYTEVGLSQKNDYHIHLSKMIEFCESFDFVFLGLFSVDIRHSQWDRHFGNAFFVHKSEMGNVVL